MSFSAITERSKISFREGPLGLTTLVSLGLCNSKPDPEPYLLALSRFGIEPSKALVIEDSERGLRSAVAAGIHCAAVYHPFTADQDFTKARYRFRDLGELKHFLLG